MRTFEAGFCFVERDPLSPALSTREKQRSFPWPATGDVLVYEPFCDTRFSCGCSFAQRATIRNNSKVHQIFDHAFQFLIE